MPYSTSVHTVKYVSVSYKIVLLNTLYVISKLTYDFFCYLSASE